MCSNNATFHAFSLSCLRTGVDPEGSKLRFSISGPVFSVDRDSGVVRLRQSLDREQQDTVEVIISLTGELLAVTPSIQLGPQ